ncbi:MAG: Cell division ATP-binding protein FtsE [Candidatus Uhrbacteria bacterium GW2011_GWF2_41_16]|uniref:Cell division ATP-binding protein FtsE n=2 Tax=Candidatus Uhriibacteriota TaxID=1752732 RepID=A0A0G0YCJ6_9BACT|nr:MAG: Cell division ATP-binding protein FtsE [Candidatus Uhrbacteria bacterium GW2011_GWC2_41_11]KKR98047.1 MAG: Cell division ATP-binding protein FtsE [Candidatus Uhrbacteria bacterium GW2011_GWF2_41_16]
MVSFRLMGHPLTPLSLPVSRVRGDQQPIHQKSIHFSEVSQQKIFFTISTFSIFSLSLFDPPFMIRLKNVSKVYHPQTVALQHVNLHIKPGEFVSVVGQSGTGKSTFAKLLYAEERPTDGNVIIGGWDISRIRDAEVPLLRRQIGVVFQDFKLLSKKTVSENVAFALQVAGARHGHIRDLVPHVLHIVNLQEKANRYPRQLSGGEQQRVAIARALVHRPKIIVADEPTGNLDAVHTHDIINLLKKINEFGTTIILVTHNREIVNSLRKRVITLDHGEIVSDQEEGRYRL